MREISRNGVMLNCPSVKNNNELIEKITIMTPPEFGRKDEAWFLMHKISSMVEPLMKKHGFKVRHFTEFHNPKLLGQNLNRGQKIWVRLRSNRNKNEFLPLGSLLGTMLHELTHNIIGPHNDAFNKFWKDMVSELETMMMDGFTGSGFFSGGRRLGIVPRDRNYSRSGISSASVEDAFRRGPGRRLGTSNEDTSGGSTNSRENGIRLGTSDQHAISEPQKKLRNNKNQMKLLILQALEKRIPAAMPPKPVRKSSIPYARPSTVSASSSSHEILLDENSDDEDLFGESLKDDDLRMVEMKIRPGAYANLKIELVDHGDDDLEITGVAETSLSTAEEFKKNEESARIKIKEETIDLTEDD